MADETVFVGREDELKQWAKVLASTKGCAVLVVGEEGMGKTLLLNRMVSFALKRSELTCGAVRYEVAPTDSVNDLLQDMMRHAYEAANPTEDGFSGTERRREEWRAFLDAFRVGDLWTSPRAQDAQGVREQFVTTLGRVSDKMPENGRALFAIDAEKHMQPESAEAWAVVVRNLPRRIKLLFAQRPDDALASSAIFGRMRNVVRIPEGHLSELDEEALGTLIGARLSGVKVSFSGARHALKRFGGHPYTEDAALGLIADGMTPGDLPSDTAGTVTAQWKGICQRGPNAISLFEAHAILEVPVPDDVVEAVSGLSRMDRVSLTAHPSVAGLVREEADGLRVYHTLLADHIRGQISDSEAGRYHERAVEVYRQRLHAREQPDALAARRLPEHVLGAEGEGAFVKCFISECMKPLLSLGLLDAAIGFSERALEMVPKGSANEAALLGNLGLIYRRRGELDRAEEAHQKSLAICEQMGDQRGISRQCGNLGLIYQARGELDRAEEMHRRGLEIDERVGNHQGMAGQYGSLGTICKKREDAAAARDYWIKARDLYQQAGMPHMVAKMQKLIDGLPDDGERRVSSQ
jgi:hypothetical protein